jgi:hypothetical protein
LLPQEEKTENRSADERRQEADGDLLGSAKLLA